MRGSRKIFPGESTMAGPYMADRVKDSDRTTVLNINGSQTCANTFPGIHTHMSPTRVFVIQSLCQSKHKLACLLPHDMCSLSSRSREIQNTCIVQGWHHSIKNRARHSRRDGRNQGYPGHTRTLTPAHTLTHSRTHTHTHTHTRTHACTHTTDQALPV